MIYSLEVEVFYYTKKLAVEDITQEMQRLHLQYVYRDYKITLVMQLLPLCHT